MVADRDVRQKIDVSHAREAVSPADIRSQDAHKEDVSGSDSQAEAAGPAAPRVRTPEPLVAQLFDCVEDAAARIFDPVVKNRLMLGLAVLQASYDIGKALDTVEKCQISGAELEELSRAVLAIASRDLALALKLVERQMEGEFKNRYIKAMAHTLAEVSPDKAAQVALHIEPRVAREVLLLELVEMAVRRSPENAIKVSERILEPLWNDEAFSVIADTTAIKDPQKALVLLERIEGELVKRWTVLHIAFRVAARDPLAAIALERLLPTAYFKDELYAEVVPLLAPVDSEKALAVALRISDPVAKKRAVVGVAQAMFHGQPALSLHVLEQNLGLVDYERELVVLLSTACREKPEAFLKQVLDPGSTLSKECVVEALQICCADRPTEVRHATQVLQTAPDAALTSCFVCAGLERPARDAAMGISDPAKRNEAFACLAAELAMEDLPAALEVVKLIDDELARSVARTAIVGRLARADRADHARQVISSISDPYLASLATLSLAVSGDEKTRLELVARVEMRLPLVLDAWRRDDLLVALVGLTGTLDVQKAVELASAISSPDLQETVLGSLAASWYAQDPVRAAGQRELFLDLTARGQWCLHLARLAVTAGEVQR